jgi:lipopolysaccharide/colanic/teichoic acid biosynthesis glycosyltransferase
MYRFFFKRFFDLFLSAFAILILLPLFLLVIIALLLTGEHYVFYFQERIGYKNQKFKIFKFATMLKNSPKMGSGLHTTINDPRILPFGSFLRKTKINELPQLFNIFYGSLSIVGPRPLVDKTFEPYSKNIKTNIYNIKPGLSGIGSIIFRDEETLMSKSKIPLNEYYKKYISPYKGELEIWYQKKISFYTDFMIILLTVWTVLFPKSDLVFKVFKDLPKKPDFLNRH